MVEIFLGGGVMMWPMLLLAIGVVAVAIRAGMTLFRVDHGGLEAERSLQSILFWGAMGLILGLLGTVVGLVQLGQAISRVPTVATSTIWSGIAVSLITLIFGLLILLLALVLWSALRWRQGQMLRGARTATV